MAASKILFVSAKQLTTGVADFCCRTSLKSKLIIPLSRNLILIKCS